MAHTYLLFDFGSDEEKAQQARHKLEGWKQAFRLDKKLLYKLDRGEGAENEAGAAAPKDTAESDAAPSKSPKSGAKSSKPAKSGAKSSTKSKSPKSAAEEESASAPAANGQVSLLVRLYFSGHEKLTEQRWLDRIPTEEPFKDASPRVIRQGEPQFDELVQQFEALE
jgi:hypothetical protein